MLDITDLRMNGTMPFVSHADDMSDRLREARAQLLVLELAFRTASDLANEPSSADTIATLNPYITADAIAGVATLVALAQHHRDMADEQQAAPRVAAVAA